MQSVLLFFNERGVRQVSQYSWGSHFNAVPLQTNKQLCFIFILPFYSNMSCRNKNAINTIYLCLLFVNERGVRQVFCMPEGDTSTEFLYKQKQNDVCAFIYVLLLYSYNAVTIKMQ